MYISFCRVFFAPNKVFIMSYQGYNGSAMRKGIGFPYNGKVGRWWLRHSLDAAHRRAYKKVAAFIRDSYVQEPGTIVDYACGPGHLLALLSLEFRKSRLIGLDGSSFMLMEALQHFAQLPAECSSRISLIETRLPDFTVLRRKAELVVFCFPNMVPFANESTSGPASGLLSENDRKVARSLSLSRDDESDESPELDPEANQAGLEQGRVISRNLRRLLVPGGICVRVEYATMRRHELSPLELAQVAFEEGSLDTAVDGRMPSRWFRLVASAYFRSLVLEDVYEQTGDARDKNGGYLITVLRAI
jgi:SAM-dependent methyltransferase